MLTNLALAGQLKAGEQPDVYGEINLSPISGAVHSKLIFAILPGHITLYFETPE